MIKKKVSVKMENLDCVIGKSTKKYNTVTMRVDRDFILEALDLYEAERKGVPPEKGLTSIELIAVYRDEEKKEHLEIIEVDSDPVIGDELSDSVKAERLKESEGKISSTIDEAFEALDEALGFEESAQ